MPYELLITIAGYVVGLLGVAYAIGGRAATTATRDSVHELAARVTVLEAARHADLDTLRAHILPRLERIETAVESLSRHDRNREDRR